MTSYPIIGYAGLTHLGLCSVIAAASKGFTTIGFDPDSDRVRRVDTGQLPVIEPGLDDLLHAKRGFISFTADPSQLAKCDVIYIAPDIPTDETGQSDLRWLNDLLDLVLPYCRKDSIVVLLSQVPPGFTRMIQCSNLQIYYQVETLVFGRAVERATKPERLILGCADPTAPLPAALDKYLRAFECPVLLMRFESAEFTKISINCCLVASVSVANTLAEICERIGADWSEIVPALRLDKRIGPHSYLSPGLGLAGGNLERDLRTVLDFSEEYGTDGSVINAFVSNSSYRKDWTLRQLHTRLFAELPNATIAILGLAYKENTNSTKNSPSLALILQLSAWKLRVFDPVVPASAALHPALTGAQSPIEAMRGVDGLAIMTPWPEFRNLSCADIATAMRGRLVLDPYRVLEAKAARKAGLDYHTLGAV